jgi:bifunctional enzyme CysN/CysC
MAYAPPDLVTSDIEAYLKEHQHKGLLRFITCGSVDDGKSTLIGRLLYDSKLIFADQLAALETDSKRFGTQTGQIDFALLVDGLEAEREQGITIDVAYRFFATDKRKFIVADTPGHEQYTRNMVTGASTADLAVILVDARLGVVPQTRRHSYIAALMGIPHIVLAVNKMDLVGYSPERLEEIVETFRKFAGPIGITSFKAIPISALRGDNITSHSARMGWYDGPTLIEHLETVPLSEDQLSAQPFCMPVQWVNRSSDAFRGFAGTIASGVIRPGDPVRIARSGVTSSIARIVSPHGDLGESAAGQSVMLTLRDEIDCSRGDVISAADAPPELADQFAATLVWMSEQEMLPGRRYWLKIGTATTSATITTLRHKVNIDTHEHVASKTLELNDIGAVNIALQHPVAFAPFVRNRDLGSFILIDRVSNATVAAGMIQFALRRAQNIHWQHLDVTREAHAELKGQEPRVLWFTGLSGAGKSTIANLVEKKLHSLGRHTFLLDGDNVRHGLNKDLGFTDADRVENIRRIGEVAKLMADAGLIVLTAFISPFRAERQMVRSLFASREFIEVHVDAPLAEAERRDVKGLYAKARAGRLKNFTGFDSPYEPPEHPEIRIDTMLMTPEQAADEIVEQLLALG